MAEDYKAKYEEALATAQEAIGLGMKALATAKINRERMRVINQIILERMADPKTLSKQEINTLGRINRAMLDTKPEEV